MHAAGARTRGSKHTSSKLGRHSCASTMSIRRAGATATSLSDHSRVSCYFEEGNRKWGAHSGVGMGRALVRGRARAHVCMLCARVHVCARVCVRARACARARVCVCVCVCVSRSNAQSHYPHSSPPLHSSPRAQPKSIVFIWAEVSSGASK